MKKTVWIILGVLLLLVVLIAGSFIGVYNRLQLMDENVNAQWAQVDNQLKRRNDLIRAKLGGAMSKNDMKAIEQSNSDLSNALSRLLMVVERYPDLKADKQFINLQDELAGTENRLAVARKDYNESVKQINATVRTFPTSIVAAISGIKAREYFETPETEKKAPEVKF